MYSYAVYLCAVPVILSGFSLGPRKETAAKKIFEDLSADSQTAVQNSERAWANVWSDCLQLGDTCDYPGERPTGLMADVPLLE